MSNLTATIFNLEVVKNDFTRTFKGTKAVTVLADTYAVEVHHYQACICKVKADGTVVIDNGGYETKTTKNHINTCLERLGIRLYIGQRKFQWYLGDKEFQRHMTITK